jgi:large subunit ribosomal protein L14
MIKKQTLINISDGSNVKWLQAFHLYSGFHNKYSSISFFVKGSSKIVTPVQPQYKGFKVKFNKKGDVIRILLIRTSYKISRLDGSNLKFYSNNGILIKKKQDIKSKYLYGPIPFNFKRRKITSLFSSVV